MECANRVPLENRNLGWPSILLEEVRALSVSDQSHLLFGIATALEQHKKALSFCLTDDTGTAERD